MVFSKYRFSHVASLQNEAVKVVMEMTVHEPKLYVLLYFATQFLKMITMEMQHHTFEVHQQVF